MAKTKENKTSTKAAKERWASDLIVDLLHAYECLTRRSIPARATAGCTIRS